MYFGSPQHLKCSSTHTMQGVKIRMTISEKNIGSLNLDRACASSWGMPGPIRRSFAWLSSEAFKVLNASHVPCCLEYGVPTSFSCTGGAVRNLEMVQRKVPSMVFEPREHSYERDRTVSSGVLMDQGYLICTRFIARRDSGFNVQAKVARTLSCTE